MDARTLGLIEDMAVIEDVGEAGAVKRLLRWLNWKGLLRDGALVRECANPRCRVPFVANTAGRPRAYCSRRCAAKPGTSSRSEVARRRAEAIRERYGPEHFREIGARGGRAARRTA